MRKHVDYTGTHKIITRDQYLKSLPLIIAEKLRWILEQHKTKGEGK